MRDKTNSTDVSVNKVFNVTWPQKLHRSYTTGKQQHSTTFNFVLLFFLNKDLLAKDSPQDSKTVWITDATI